MRIGKGGGGASMRCPHTSQYVGPCFVVRNHEIHIYTHARSNVIYQKGTSICKGFGFVNMATRQQVHI